LKEREEYKMALRKALAYSKKRVRPYTRKSGKKAHSFVKAVPPNKIVRYNMGDIRGFNQNKYKFILRFVSEEKVQIRDNALEACRMMIHKIMDVKAPGQYYFAVKVYPHHVQRENKSAGGMAGADRISTGMTQSFGVTIGRAAIVNAGKEIFVIACANEKVARDAREAIKKARPKLPCSGRLIFDKIE
jgi:large subunit ribosomal protein L10e